MSSSTHRLDLLRRDIDAVDVALHDLIVKRATIVEDIRKIKDRTGPALRPGREAAILRRLVENHRGAFPVQSLTCIWREMISTFTQMQEAFSVAVYAPPGEESLLGLARDHYGSRTQLLPTPTASAAVRAVADHAAHVAVLPLPAEDQSENWWLQLMGTDDKTPRVISRLPFLADGKGRQALAIAGSPRDTTDADATLIAIELTERASRGRMATELAAAGFSGVAPLAGTVTPAGRICHLVEVDRAIVNDDPRIKAIRAQLGDIFVSGHVIGGYARQIVLPEG